MDFCRQLDNTNPRISFESSKFSNTSPSFLLDGGWFGFGEASKHKLGHKRHNAMPYYVKKSLRIGGQSSQNPFFPFTDHQCPRRIPKYPKLSLGCAVLMPPQLIYFIDTMLILCMVDNNVTRINVASFREPYL